MQLRDPCKKCLVRPACKKESYYCDKVKNYRSFKDARFAILVSILLVGSAISLGLHLSFQINKTPDNIIITIKPKTENK